MQSRINHGFSSMPEHLPATGWSEHTQVQAAPVTQVCTHGHSICQQTDRWKGWTPGLSEGVTDVGGGGGNALHSHSRVTQGPWKWKKNHHSQGRLEEHNSRGGEGSTAPLLPHITWPCWKADANLFNLTMISWMADSPSFVTDIWLQAGNWNLCV